MYLALYRKYRPRKFAEVIGQDHIIKTLQNQIALDKVGHAYLFCGSRGTGKTSTAKIFAREINCTCNGKGECNFCKDFQSLDILEIDAASNNGVDEIRDLREKVKYPPVDGKYKVYIIDEVHMLSPSAFNALLKTLEEPPKHAVFILATTEVHKLPATILSRCMRFDFKLVSVEDLAKLLTKVFDSENVSYDQASLNLIARAGEGSVRDTLSIADRCVSFAGDNLSSKLVVEVLGATEKQNLIEISQSILSGTIGDALGKLDNVLSGGKSPLVLSKDLVCYFRDLLIINALKERADSMIIANPDDYAQMKAQATDKNYAKIVKVIELLSGVEADLRYSVQPRIVLETCIIKLFAQQSVEERLEKLERMLASGAIAPATNNSQILNNNQASQANLASKAILAGENSAQNLSKMSNESQTMAADNAPNMERTAPSQAASGDKLLGQILTYLREQKLMSLLMACRQITKIVLVDKVAKLYIRDSSAIALLSSEKYSKVISEYLDNFGYKWQIVGQNATANPIGDLSNKLGGKLEIK